MTQYSNNNGYWGGRSTYRNPTTTPSYSTYVSIDDEMTMCYKGLFELTLLPTTGRLLWWIGKFILFVLRIIGAITSWFGNQIEWMIDYGFWAYVWAIIKYIWHLFRRMRTYMWHGPSPGPLFTPWMECKLNTDGENNSYDDVVSALRGKAKKAGSL